MITVRQIAACVLSNPAPGSALTAWKGDVSVLQDLSGAASSPSPLSLLELARSLTQKQVDLNLIYVGFECLTADDYEKVNDALQLARACYAFVDLGIGRAGDFFISVVEAQGREIISDHAEANALIKEWTFPNDAIDVFFVVTFEGLTVGTSPTNGDCDKELNDERSGVVIGVEESTFITGQTLAHEVGHFLGLDRTHPGHDSHSPDPNNLMFEKVPNGGQLTPEQGRMMKKHCSIKTRCRGK
jgi:hypothetical protein